MTIHNVPSLFMSIASILSTVACFIVFIIYTIRYLVANRLFNKIVLWIAISDFLSALGTVGGYARDGSFECWFQSMFANIFPLCSFFYTMVVAFKIIQSFQLGPDGTFVHVSDTLPWYGHAMVIGSALTITFTPFTTNTYGCLPGYTTCWCYITSTGTELSDNMLFFWYIMAFYAWVWVALFVYLACFLYTIYSLNKLSPDIRQMVYPKLMKLVGYPIVLVVCWTMLTVSDLYARAVPSSDIANYYIFNMVAYTLPCFQGLFTSLTFIFTNNHTITAYMSPSKSVHLVSNEDSKSTYSKDTDVSKRVKVVEVKTSTTANVAQVVPVISAGEDSTIRYNASTSSNNHKQQQQPESPVVMEPPV